MTDAKWEWIAQDQNGCIAKYAEKPDKNDAEWFKMPHELVQGVYNWHVDEWEQSIINLETHDYKIEDGILIRVDRVNQKRHKHADLMIAYANDMTLKIQYKDGNMWFDIGDPAFHKNIEYRIKPKNKTVRFRNYLAYGDEVYVSFDESDTKNNGFIKWIGDWQELEIPE